MITTTFKIRIYMKNRFFTVPECFQPNDDVAADFQAIRRSTNTEKCNYLDALRAQGHCMFDSAGEPIMPSPITYVPLNGQTWEVLKTRVKVPFASNYTYLGFNFKGYGLIRNVATQEELYLKSDVIKQMPLRAENVMKQFNDMVVQNFMLSHHNYKG